VGYPFSPTGMGEHLRVSLRSMQAAGVDVRLVDVADTQGLGDPAFEPLKALLADRLDALNVFCVNADEVDRVIDRLGRPAFKAATNVIYPAWELAKYPAPYARAVSQFDEVWAPSAFIADAIAEAIGKPAHVIPLAVEPTMSRFLGRRYFDIPEAPFTVLFFFDFASYAARKNPEAVLTAFELLSARRPDAELHCVMKVRGVPADRQARDAFHARLAALGERVQVLEGDFSDNEIKNLIRLCDVFVSLHRSEGFGRGSAEAMAMGRPAIATGYSGNVDFMPPGTSLLADYQLIPVAPGAYPHGEGQVWADASPEHAARLMESLLDNPREAAALGARGRQHVRETLSYEAVGGKFLGRLRALADR
jgi:glycosyltransferase involved in cell wall biosynthesis